MNHISKKFVSSDGHLHRSHSWELREGGYRRTALLVGNGLWPVEKETRLISFLMDRGFRALALDLAFGSPQLPRLRLAQFRLAIEEFAREGSPYGQPLYLLASSFSASALLPVASGIQDIAALALVSPVVEFPPTGLKVPLFFLPGSELPMEMEAQSGTPDSLQGFLEGRPTLRFHKRDLKMAAADISRSLEAPLGVPAAIFAGEEDPLLTEAGRKALAQAGAKVYSYPRVKREPAHDRYVDNFYADLGSFLDEVEAGKAR